jgi:DNA-directed RNA polymerase subunit RPC12/RpoP
MGTIPCPDCGGVVSEVAPSCPHCGRPLRQQGSPLPAPSSDQTSGAEGTKCPYCGKMITPVVTSVGGGSCSFGSRERWTCPACMRVIHRRGCFVATSTYGDEDLVEVHLLRLFRDRYLLRHPVGRVFVQSYYRLGPSAACLVERSPLLRSLARRFLDEVVARIEALTPITRDRVREELARSTGKGVRGRGN